MVNEIRIALEKIRTIETIEGRSSELDACFSWINEEVEVEGPSEIDLKIINNLKKSHCREFLKFMSTYGNSGYEEVVPLRELFCNHYNVFFEVENEEPGLLMKCRHIFRCNPKG